MLRNYSRVSAYLSLCALLLGCAGSPPKHDAVDYLARAESQSDSGIRVSASVLSPEETEASFGLPLAQKGVQPIWIEIDNQTEKQYVVMLLKIDADYFAPSEIAWKFRNAEEIGTDNRIDQFLERQLPLQIPPNRLISGYVYTNLDPGAKAFTVELFAENDVRSFEFVQLIPGFEADFMRVDFEQIYPASQMRDLDLDELRDYLEELPCCVAGGDGESPGDPLNLVMVGQGQHLLATLTRRGWDLTETLRPNTVWRTVAASLFGGYYRTSPVSPLYLFGRPHDIALQKIRGSVDERNHLRLWLAPVTLAGQSVWVGQISRDIGIKLTSKTLVTHKIDPVVDEARTYITLDMAASETLRALGHVKGVGYSDRIAPQYNYTGDPFYTDGLRAVLILDEGRRPLEGIKRLRWAQPLGPGRRPERVEHAETE